MNDLKIKLAEEEAKEKSNAKELIGKEQSRYKQLMDITTTVKQVDGLKDDVKKQEAIIVKFKDEMADPLMFVD